MNHPAFSTQVFIFETSEWNFLEKCKNIQIWKFHLQDLRLVPGLLWNTSMNHPGFSTQVLIFETSEWHFLEKCKNSKYKNFTYKIWDESPGHTDQAYFQLLWSTRRNLPAFRTPVFSTPDQQYARISLDPTVTSLLAQPEGIKPIILWRSFNNSNIKSIKWDQATH